MMLILNRRPGERVLIGDGISVTALESSGSRIRLGFTAPPEIVIRRAELPARMKPSWLLATARRFGFVLDRQTRQRVFEPAVCDLELDFAESCELRRSLAGRTTLTGCFAFRMVWTLFGCLAVGTTAQAIAKLLRHQD